METTIVKDLSALKFVMIGVDTAYIDSRVYCRDIIQVDHHDWMSNVIYKYQTLIEQQFQTLRFENAVLKHQNSKGASKQKYVVLTEAQCNFALSLSNNTPEVVSKKAELIADFERAKKLLKKQLQAQFSKPTTEAATVSAAPSNLLATIAELEEAKWQLELWVEGYEAELYELADSKRQLQEQLLAPYTPTPAIAQQPLIARLQARISQLELELVFKETQNPVGYDYHFCQVWKMTGIVNRQVFYNKARALLVRGVDYDDREDDLMDGYCMTYPAMIKVLLTLRSRKGIQWFCLRGGLTLEKLKIYKRLGIERLTALFPKVV